MVRSAFGGVVLMGNGSNEVRAYFAFDWQVRNLVNIISTS